MSRPARALLFLVRLYRSFFSGLMPSACKFYPSCSHYAADALRLHGARRGSWLALRRVLRCHPFTRGGVDLVPDANESSARVPRVTDSPSIQGSLAAFGGVAGPSKNPRACLQDTQAEACATREAQP
jgi:uncharacterized protein